MIPDLDIYRSTNLLVKHHGQDASIEAAMRADAMLEEGDLDGNGVWRRILRAVEEIRRTRPSAEEMLRWEVAMLRMSLGPAVPMFFSWGRKAGVFGGGR